MNDLYPNIFKNLTRKPITVILLDNRKQTMVYDKTTKLSSLFHATCDLCYLECDNLFGFAILMDDYYAFLDLDTKVCKINFKEYNKKSQSNVLFKPCISFASPVHQVVNDNRRHSYGLHILRDLDHKIKHSIASTKSAPISNHKEDDDDIPVIYFRIKFYVFSHCLLDRITKMLYFQQLMRNVLQYKLQCTDEIYLQLGAYAIQAFYGDYNLLLSSVNDDQISVTSTNTDSSTNAYSPTLAKLSRLPERYNNFTREQILLGRYFDPRKFFPEWIITKYTPQYLHKEISQLHKGLTGLSRLDAEFCYIRMTSAQYSNFNMHLFPVRDQSMSGGNSGLSNFPGLINTGKQNGRKTSKNKLWLGLSPTGLEMHEVKTNDFLIHMSTLKWSDIDEVTQKSYRINIHVGGRILKLYTYSKMEADHLFWLTRHMHMYQAKAKLNATFTAETFDSVERLKYREKYVYMDLEDLKQHGMHPTDESDRFIDEKVLFVKRPVCKPRMPSDNTPAVPARRNLSNTRIMKNKEELNNFRQFNESLNGNIPGIKERTKKPQYIKKMNPSSQSNTYTNMIDRAIRSPEIIPRNSNNIFQLSECRTKNNKEKEYSFLSDLDSDQNFSREYKNIDEFDSNSSFNESEPRYPGQTDLRYIGRFISLSQDFSQLEVPKADIIETSSQDILPPKQFREPSLPNIYITKSVSYDHYDLVLRKLSKTQSRKISPRQLQSESFCQSLPLKMGLCYEFNKIKEMVGRKSKKLNNASRNQSVSKLSEGMKSWKSDILFNLNNCVNEKDQDWVQFSNSTSSIDIESHISRRNSLPHHQYSYHDLISSSSTLDSDTDHDSVEISSLSSFDFDRTAYVPFNRNNSTKIKLSIVQVQQ